MRVLEYQQAHNDGSAAYLRCHELRSTTERTGCLAEPHVLFAKTVVSDLDMAVERQKDVVQLEITAIPNE